MKQAIKQYLERHGFEALRPKAVLFDMDGVLYDSMPNHAVAWQTSMKKFGIDMTAEDAYATEGARGVDTIRMMVKEQQGREIDEQEAQRMYDEKSSIFHKMKEAPVMPGVIRLIRQLHAGGMMMCVVTGSGQRPLINRLMKDFGDYLDEAHITTAYDVKRGKPNPDPYIMGLQKAGGLQPWEAIVVENAPLGVRAGVAARIFTIGVNTGPLPDSALAEADLVVKPMERLADIWSEIIEQTEQTRR
jgi:HAD superfamily hydrolase (TIGR01509 family)